MPEVKIIECPRDAMQGIKEFIPTELKVKYINQLLKAGFDTIDFGSFVSPAAVPQMSDTAQVLEQLDLEGSKSKLLAIIANVRGAQDAALFKEICYLGFPLSLSETFQKRNTNKSIEEAFVQVKEIQAICEANKKEFVVYLSMGFGNPYGDPYDVEYVKDFTGKLFEIGVRIVSLSDTIGVAQKEDLHYLFSSLIPAFPTVEFGAHLHASPFSAVGMVKEAYLAGCRRFDGALKGFGGCPMAKDDLVGNIPTEKMLEYFTTHNISTGVDLKVLEEAMAIAAQVFPQ
jgi:hydroxymethylglutaryl-CoA lyase